MINNYLITLKVILKNYSETTKYFPSNLYIKEKTISFYVRNLKMAYQLHFFLEQFSKQIICQYTLFNYTVDLVEIDENENVERLLGCYCLFGRNNFKEIEYISHIKKYKRNNSRHILNFREAFVFLTQENINIFNKWVSSVKKFGKIALNKNVDTDFSKKQIEVFESFISDWEKQPFKFPNYKS